MPFRHCHSAQLLPASHHRGQVASCTYALDKGDTARDTQQQMLQGPGGSNAGDRFQHQGHAQLQGADPDGSRAEINQMCLGLVASVSVPTMTATADGPRFKVLGPSF